MRQRPLMIIEPNPIAQIDTPAAQRAAFEMFGLNQWRSADLSADHGARRARFFDWHDGGHGHHLKKFRSRFYSGPDSIYGAGLHPTLLPCCVWVILFRRAKIIASTQSLIGIVANGCSKTQFNLAQT